MWQQFKLYLARLIKWTKVTGSTVASGRTFLATDAVANDEDDDFRPIAGETRLFQHFGFRSRPPVGSEQIVVACRGSKEQQAAIATESPTHGPTALEEGEVALYNKVSGTQVKLDKDGQILATAKNAAVTMDKDGQIVASTKGASLTLDKDGQIIATTKGSTVKIDLNGKTTVDAVAGQDVVVNGGTKEVARKTDHVSGGQLKATLTGGGGFSVYSLYYIDADGTGALTPLLALVFDPMGALVAASSVPTAATPIVTRNVTEKISEGATRFKA